MGYLCTNFGLPMPLCSRLRPDVRDRRVRETDVRRQTKASLNAPAYEGIIYYYAPTLIGGGIIMYDATDDRQ